MPQVGHMKTTIGDADRCWIHSTSDFFVLIYVSICWLVCETNERLEMAFSAERRKKEKYAFKPGSNVCPLRPGRQPFALQLLFVFFRRYCFHPLSTATVVGVNLTGNFSSSSSGIKYDGDEGTALRQNKKKNSENTTSPPCEHVHTEVD